MCPWHVVGGKMSDNNLEQRINIEFCVEIGKSASEMLALAVQGRARRCARRHKKWAATNAKDRRKCGQSTSLGGSDQRGSVRVIAEELNMNRETV